jgi:hypothetical protein
MDITDDREEKIRRRAHQLWEQNGSPEGRETEFWFQAEKEIDGDTDGSAPLTPE